MADETNDQSDSSLPPIIDKSSFPMSGVPNQGVSKSDDADDLSSSLPQDLPIDIQSITGNGSDDDQTDTDDSERPEVDAPEIADDNDLIEKEWVNKAKNIIEKTKNDPHQQSDAITLFKADYIKKRYNKTIKTDE